MSKKNGNQSNASSGKGGSMLAGILLGMVLGLLIAGGVAWYITKIPSPFVDKEDQRKELTPEPLPPSAMPEVKPAPQAAPSAQQDNGKPRFEFYKVLTDKQEGAAAQQPAAPAAPAPSPAKAASSQVYYLQAGSFSNEADADKLKARLALMGKEASVQSVTIPGKGVWHRVRLGPYNGSDAMNKARASLKQNGLDATPTRAQ